MMTITDIQEAIIGLSDADHAQLVRWLQDQDWERWEQELEEGAAAGRLDSLASEALAAKARGEIKDLKDVIGAQGES